MKTLKILAIVSAICLLFACSSNYNKEALGTSADSFSVTGLSGESVKLIKTADMDFKVQNVHESARVIVKAAHSMNGLVTDRRIESEKKRSKELRVTDDTLQVISSYIIRANMQVRVPSAKLDTFIEQVYNTASFVNNINIKIEDKTLDYLASRLKQQNREQVLQPSRERNQKQEQVEPGNAVKDKSFKPADLIETKDQIIDQKIANRQIDSDVNYSTVHLSFTQNPVIRMELMANTDLSVYRLPFWWSMGHAFSSGWQYFLNFIIGLTHLWMFILSAIIIIAGLRYYKLWKAEAQ